MCWSVRNNLIVTFVWLSSRRLEQAFLTQVAHLVEGSRYLQVWVKHAEHQMSMHEPLREPALNDK